MPTGRATTDLNRMSSFLGLMTQSDNAPVEVTPPEGDLQTAIWFGEYIALTLARLNLKPNSIHKNLHSLEVFIAGIIYGKYALYHVASHGLFQMHVSCNCLPLTNAISSLACGPFQ